MQETQVQTMGQEDPWRKEWKPISVFFPGEFHGERTPAVYSLGCWTELDMTEQLTPSLSWCRHQTEPHYRHQSQAACPKDTNSTVWLGYKNQGLCIKVSHIVCTFLSLFMVWYEFLSAISVLETDKDQLWYLTATEWQVCKAALRGNVVWTASKVFFSSEMLRCYNYKYSGPSVIVILLLNFIWLSKVSLTLYKALPPSWSNIKPDFLPLPHMTLNMTLFGNPGRF